MIITMDQLSWWVLPIFAALSVVSLWSAFHALRTGELTFRIKGASRIYIVNRTEKPIDFWFNVILLIAVPLFLSTAFGFIFWKVL